MVTITEFARAIQMALKSNGLIVFGYKETKRAVLLGKAKLIVVAANAPPEMKKELRYYAKLSNIPVYEFPDTNTSLGAISGKPFSVAALAVINPGQSNIVELIREELESKGEVS